MRGLITKYYFLEVEIKENGMCGLCAVAVLVMMCSIRLHGLPTHLAARAKLQGSIHSNLTYRSFNMQRSEELVTTTRMWPSDSCPFLPNFRQNSTRVRYSQIRPAYVCFCFCFYFCFWFLSA